MAKLTDKEWDQVKAPFCFLRIDAPPSWRPIHYAMIGKWLDANMSGWWYGNTMPITAQDKIVTYIFQHEGDRTLFKLWISDDPFTREGGVIEIVNIHTGEEATLKVEEPC